MLYNLLIKVDVILREILSLVGGLFMKKILVCVLTAVMVGATFVGCTSDNKTDAGQEQAVTINVKDELAKLEADYPLRMPADVTEQELTEMYGVSMDNIEEYALRHGMMTPGIDVMGIFKAKDGQVDTLKTDLEKILEVKRNAAYLPGEMEALDNAKIVDNGNYVGIFLLQGEEEGALPADEAVEKFNSLF